MLHACLCTICFVFCYTSWRFYAFFRTNLLTKCHSASSLSTQEIFSKLDETKAKVHIFPHTRLSPKLIRRGTRVRPNHRVARANPWPRHQVVGPPGPSPDAALPPIYFPQRENPRARSIFHETYCKPPPSSTRDRGGPEALSGTLPERGITAGGLLHHHVCLDEDSRLGRRGIQTDVCGRSMQSCRPCNPSRVD
jgi:hypothetical protein